MGSARPRGFAAHGGGSYVTPRGRKLSRAQTLLDIPQHLCTAEEWNAIKRTTIQREPDVLPRTELHQLAEQQVAALHCPFG